MAEDGLNVAAGIIALFIIWSISPNLKASKNYLKSIDKKMHTHAVDDVKGIGGWY